MKTQYRNKENIEPQEDLNPIPHIVIGLVVALIIWAVAYIFVQRPNASPTLGDHRNVSLLNMNDSQKKVGSAAGNQIFTANCQACHQANGEGLAGVFPPLAGSPIAQGDPAILKQILLHGLTGKIEVLGKSYNGSMPVFGSVLTDAEIAAVLTYVRSQWSNKASEINSSSVQGSRQLSNSKNTPWSSLEEIQQFIVTNDNQASKP